MDERIDERIDRRATRVMTAEVTRPRGLIAEDEPLMAERLRRMLADVWPELDLVCIAQNGEEAIAFHAATPVDVMFLDIRMPGRTGLEVASLVLPGPQVVFTTAYDEHAIAAFDAGAIDYLLKPVVSDRLARAVERLRPRLAAPAATADGEIERLMKTLTQALVPAACRAPAFLTWLRCSLGSTMRLVKVADVVYFESDSKYTRVVTTTGEGLVRIPIRDLLSGLDPAVFWQVHRATIVNIEAIDRVVRDSPERLRIDLKGRDEHLTVSRAYLHLFRRD